MAQKLDAQGGNGAEKWDDGGAHQNVKKVYVGQGDSGVVYIKFDYEKDGKIVSLEHGKKTVLGTEDFVLDPEDYITSVQVYYDKVYGTSTELITSLIFKTFKGVTSQPFGMPAGEVAELKGGKIIGFHGSSGDAIHSLGAYIAPSTTPISPSGPTKLEAQGGQGKEKWDDGGVYDNVKKVYVGQGDSGVVYVKFDYEKDGKIVSLEHGKKTVLGTENFELDPDDYITSVQVYYDKVYGSTAEIITSLIFKTHKGITSQPFGMPSGEVAELGVGKIVGFHGTSGDAIHSLGAYIAPSTTPISGPTKVEAQGGRGGEGWDDGGAYDNVKKVYVGQGDSGVVYVKFDYEKDGKIVTVEHGKKTILGTEEFEIGPGDYITSVKVYYEKIFGSPIEVITALIFKTFKGITSQPFGMASGVEAELGGGKIVGFHGSSSDLIHSLGVYVTPSTTPLTPA